MRPSLFHREYSCIVQLRRVLKTHLENPFFTHWFLYLTCLIGITELAQITPRRHPHFIVSQLFSMGGKGLDSLEAGHDKAYLQR